MQDAKSLVIYISGPMSGFPALNFPAFYEAERLLKEKGYEVINPAAIEQPIKEWINCMKLDIKALMDCDGIAMIHGWEASRGARLELHIAKELGMQAGSLDTFLRYDFIKGWKGVESR